jgi:co-chaperonin GroES (HSP10)
MFKPIFEWILVEEEAPLTQTLTGIFIPKATSAKQMLKKCKVLKISDRAVRLMEEDDEGVQYKVGDMVMHHSQTGIKVDVTDERDRRYLLKYDAVISVYDEEKADGGSN